MMKILFLNPHLHDSTLVGALRKRGLAVLVCSSVNEADLVMKLHGRTISLVCGHDEPGVELNEALKQNSRVNGIPVILSFSQWGDQQIANHSQTPLAANAYLRYPFNDDAFISTAEKVLGRELVREAASPGANPLNAEFATQTGSSSVEWATVMLNRPVKPRVEAADAQAPAAAPVPAPYSPEKTKVLSASEVAAMLKGDAKSDKKNEKLGKSSPAIPVSVQATTPEPPAAPSAEGMPLAIAEAVPSAEAAPVKSVHDMTSVALSVPAAGAEPVFDLAPESVSSQAPAATQGGLVAAPISVKVEETKVDAAPEMPIAPEFNLDALATLPADEPSSGGPLLQAATVGSIATPMSPVPDETPADLPFTLGDEAAPAPAEENFDATRVQDMNVMPARSDATATRVDEELDPDSLQEMPYLAKKALGSPLSYQQPLDDAIIPGGAVQSPDLETLKRYLLLREQDVAALSNALRQAKEQVTSVEQQLRHERAMNTEFAHLTQEQDRRIKNFEKEKEIALESAQKEIEELKFEMKKRADRVRLMEAQVRDATTETEKLKERVRSDIRKIRTREKELENRLEIMKKDSEALLMAREQKIIELKRKLDLLEFNMDLLQNQYEKEKQNSASLTEKLMKAAQVVRVAGGLLHPNETVDLSEILPEEGSKTDLKTKAS